MTEQAKLSRKDFATDQLVRWCPGCGDYSILAQVQTVFADIGRPREEYAVIAGIGCSSRFPYYMDTYGFHTIHGRAPTFAAGLKCTRPDLSVWVVTGDGDSEDIGGNHLIHVFRRNVDMNIMMFNNRIYGLTKGQYSPTSEVGKKTKSTPMGSIDNPFNPLQLALGSGATFVARSVDVFAKHLQATLKSSYAHAGTGFTEIYQNCNIFNDGAFSDFADRSVRDERVLYLEPGQPMAFGKAQRRGLVLDGTALRVIDVDSDDDVAKLHVHDPSDWVVAQLLARLDPKEGQPVPVGVLYQEQRATYDSEFTHQLDVAQEKLGPGDLMALLEVGDSWKVA